MTEVGGPQTDVLKGAFTHGCPSAPFRDVNILDTSAGSGRT